MNDTDVQGTEYCQIVKMNLVMNYTSLNNILKCNFIVIFQLINRSFLQLIVMNIRCSENGVEFCVKLLNHLNSIFK